MFGTYQIKIFCTLGIKLTILEIPNNIVSFQPAKVTAHWHKGTTYMVKFDDSVISRDKSLDDR